jgi:beta-galactosidase
VDRASIHADGKDVSVITVRVNDKKELKVTTADNSISFSISGPARIIGVGNGNPTSLEPDQFHEKISSIAIEDFGKVTGDPGGNEIDSAAITYQGSFSLPVISNDVQLIFYYNSIGSRQSIIINGKEIAKDIPQEKKGNSFILDKAILKKGVNHITIIALPLLKNHPWDQVNTHPGLIQLTIPAQDWQRKLFNGLAQVIVQSTGDPGKIKLNAMSAGLEDAAITIAAQ